MREPTILVFSLSSINELSTDKLCGIYGLQEAVLFYLISVGDVSPEVTAKRSCHFPNFPLEYYPVLRI